MIKFTDKQRPLITIGVCAFNAQETVARAIKSALAQSWPNIEIVVVDDHSTDDTWAILKQMAINHNVIRVYQNDINGGVAVSRNRIISEAKGAFIGFFDDDDESIPERIELQLQRILTYEKNFPDVSLIVCHAARMQTYPNGDRVLVETIGQIEDKKAPCGEAIARQVLLGEALEGGCSSVATCSQMARLSTYQSVGGFDAYFRRSEDTDFNIALSLLGGCFIGIKTPLVLQTMTPTIEKSVQVEYKYTKKLFYKYQDFIELKGNFPFVIKWIDIKFYFIKNQYFLFAYFLLKLFIAHPILVLKRLKQALPNIQSNKRVSHLLSKK